MGARATQPRIGWKHSGFALNGGAAVVIPTSGTYVIVATGLSNRSLCYIKVQNLSGIEAVCTLRDADESGDWEHERNLNASGVCRFYGSNNTFGALIVPCNASGDIKITSDQNGDDWKLWLMGSITSI